jgi:hypothetical protein
MRTKTRNYKGIAIDKGEKPRALHHRIQDKKMV